MHNAIEHSDMQLIAKTYDTSPTSSTSPLRTRGPSSAAGTSPTRSDLIEITAKMLARKDGAAELVDLILDGTGPKGTGKWAAQDSFDLMAATPASPM
jgi:6-phosphogluconate dehydrogenase